MKTGGMEVKCDGCGADVHPLEARAIFVTLRGPTVRFKKLDFHDERCLLRWAKTLEGDAPI